MESQESNDLYFTCSLIEFIGRKTSNKRTYVTEKMGIDGLTWVYENAQVLHCENMNAVCDEVVNDYKIEVGTYVHTTGKLPRVFGLGRTYSYLIKNLIDLEDREALIKKTYEVMTSWLVDEITYFESSLYTENPSYIKACYLANEILD